MSLVLFVLVWLSLFGLALWYVGRRIIDDTHLRERHRWTGWLVLAILFLIPQVTFILFISRVQAAWLDALSWVGYIELGLFSLVATLMLARDLVLLAGRAAGAAMRALLRVLFPSRNRQVNTGRRWFLLHTTNIGVVGIAAAASGYGFYESRFGMRVERVEVPIANLPEEFAGFRIVQFTDMHIGPTIKRGFVERVAEQVAALDGDLIAFTGDLADGSVAWLSEDVAPLQDLAAKYGKYFITGNHEYYSGPEQWIREAERLGFDVLLNEHRELKFGGGSIILGGVTDYSAGQFIRSHRSDPAAAFARAPEGVVRVLLAHQPRSIDAAVQAGIDLQLSGHTHGGQFFPWNYLATLGQPYIQGLHRHGRAWVYVSRGTGYWGPPLRLGIPPEITQVTLTRAS